MLRASQADNISHGFATISNFFPGTKELASRLMEKIAEACIGPADIGKATVFDDQYISTGGQFYELIVGHDRMNADLRPLFYKIRAARAGKAADVGLCVHPYDVASVLIAREAGVEITDGLGKELDGPLDVETGLSWAGFANKALRERIEPVMVATMRLGGWRERNSLLQMAELASIGATRCDAAKLKAHGRNICGRRLWWRRGVGHWAGGGVEAGGDGACGGGRWGGRRGGWSRLPAGNWKARWEDAGAAGGCVAGGGGWSR